MPVSELFDPEVWVASEVSRDFTDLTAHRSLDGTIVRIAFDRPEVRNAFRMLNHAFNAIDDGLVGQQLFAGEATRLAYGTAEAQEGRDAFLEKRDPDWSGAPYSY